MSGDMNSMGMAGRVGVTGRLSSAVKVSYGDSGCSIRIVESTGLSVDNASCQPSLPRTNGRLRRGPKPSGVVSGSVGLGEISRGSWRTKQSMKKA